jgi:tRNA dimethylallyltransferase
MMNKVICLFGPTAVGKTNLLWEIFQTTQSIEIINSDSLQVYKYLNLGTAKPEQDLLDAIPHHLLNIREPNEEYDLGAFCEDAERAVRDIHQRNKIPIISGGTAFYFKHLLFGKPDTPSVVPEIRIKVQADAQSLGMKKMYDSLKKLDPVSAERISPNDSYRILRALEVYHQSGKPLSSFKQIPKLRNDWDLRIIGLERNRDELYARINQRVEQMFEKGLEQEIKLLQKQGFGQDTPAFKAIGYKEFFMGYEKSKLIQEIQKNTRHYAKRQLTFFKSLESVHWFHPDDLEDILNFALN